MELGNQRSESMRRGMSAILILVCMCTFSSANANCPDGQLQFSFSNLKVREAFAILADFTGLRPEIDSSITQSEPMKFGCTPWRVVAQDLADRHKLNWRSENGVLYVSRK
jgi:hypothetical protein